MKILMVTPFYHPTTIGGTESFIETMANKLNEMGTHTDVMTFDVSQRWSRWEEVNGLNVIRIPSFSTKVSSKILDRIFQTRFIPLRPFTSIYKKYDIIHFHNDVDLTFPAFSYFIKKPKILHCHCLVLGSYKLYRSNFLSRHLLKSVADIYIATSECMLNMLVDLGVPRTKIRTVPIAINTSDFYPCENGKNEDLLLFVGRLDPRKGLHVLLKSLNYIETPIKLVIVGPISWDINYSKKMLMLIEKMKEKTIHSVTYMSALEKEELIEWYQKASILIRPDTIGASSGITSLEALACGTPVIGTGNEEGLLIIKDGVNGILIPPNNAVKLAEAIQYLLDNNKVRHKFGEEGKRFIAEHFSSEVVAKKLLQVYREIL